MSDIMQAARDYTGQGISITFTDSNKVSVGPWKEYQKRIITAEELADKLPLAKGIAIICGAVSGNLEVVDVDTKYDVTGRLMADLTKRIPDAIKNKLVMASTKSGGFHLYYRTTSVNPNTKLARRGATDEELTNNPHEKVKVLIETRGEGGYVVAPPTVGYKWLNDDITNVEYLTTEERDELFEVCRSFNTYIEEHIIETRDSHVKADYPFSPIDDFNERGDVIGLLVKHGWKISNRDNDRTFMTRPGKTHGTSGDFLHSKRWFSVFTTSSQFEPQKAYNPAAIYCLLEANGDWKQAVKQLATEGFGMDKRKLTPRTLKVVAAVKAMDLSDNDKKKRIVKETKGEINEIDAEKLLKVDVDPDSIEQFEFWSITKKGTIEIDKSLLIAFLEKHGFYGLPYDLTGNDVRIVKIVDNIVEETTTQKIKQLLRDFITKEAGEHTHRVLNAILDRYHIFNKEMLAFLKTVPDAQFLRDERHCAYYPFRNGIVKVTAGTDTTAGRVELLQYGAVGKLIWKSHIIDHDIHLDDPNRPDFLRDNDGNEINNVFAKFVIRIAGSADDRFQAFMTHIGYMIHKFKDGRYQVAVVCAEDTESDENGGGTGKSLLVKAISKMVNLQDFDGKTFTTKKSFALQRVSLDTNVISINDVKDKMDFESFYTMITEGITIEKKGKDEFHIPYERSPKFIFTTNFTIPNKGNHAVRRQKILPFSDYFGIDRTPFMEFGHMLFTDWDAGQWGYFYNFMFACVMDFLTYGIIDVEQSDRMKLKAVRNGFGPEFKEWFETWILTIHDDWYKYKDLYSEFLRMNDFTEHDYSNKRFGAGLIEACRIYHIKTERKNLGNSGGRLIRFEKLPTHSPTLPTQSFSDALVHVTP